MSRTRLDPFLIDVALVAVALADGLLYLSSLAAFSPGPWNEGTPLQVTLAVAGAAGLFLRRRWPWLSFLLAVPGLIVSSASFAGMVALYSVAVAARRRWTIVLAGVAVLAVLVSTWWGAPFIDAVIVSFIDAVMTVAAPIALGLLVRTRRELTARLEELEQVREPTAEILNAERARIAREMHDVVSHQVSLIAVQAGALQVASADPDVKKTARTVRSLAVRTLDELRQMVTVLRAPGAGAPSLAPQPTIDDLPELIQDSGITSSVDIALPEGIPASVQRAIYRTVQEALTNIRKHAPGAVAEITAGSADGDVVVSVRNAPGTVPRLPLPSARHGIIGLRERADLLGGTLTTRLDPDGTHTLTLRVPLT